ncbi:rubredoxin [Larkinella soli]|uniref:rubredoxin n=1 Tax=Larkinella soli TaxID=1770527 RepID=UPI000FFC1C0B|nr:rubredoxin [Larkinella soli]
MNTLRILTQGGTVSPGDLRRIVVLAREYGVETLEISNRQEMLLPVPKALLREDLARRIEAIGRPTDAADPSVQNVVSSLPATDVFPDTPWLTTGVYLDVLAQLSRPTRLKINLGDPAQSLVPLFSGNINFVASPEPHYWYVFLRPSGAVRRYGWPVLIETESIGAFAEVVERLYFERPITDLETFYRNVMSVFRGRTRKAEAEWNPVPPPTPVYEGFHQTRSGSYWLGLFRKTYAFPLAFVEALCELALQTRAGKLYLTPWKTFLVKDIQEKDLPGWRQLLGRFGIRTHVPSWYLNWQLPNADPEAVSLKNNLLLQLEEADVRTDELSFSVKVPFSEVAASVAIQVNGAPDRFDVYQKALSGNPNAPFVLVAKSRPADALGDVIRDLAQSYYERQHAFLPEPPGPEPETGAERPLRTVHQCPHCLTVYDPEYGEPHRGFEAGRSFGSLPEEYTCGLCDAPKSEFTEQYRPER